MKSIVFSESKRAISWRIGGFNDMLKAIMIELDICLTFSNLKPKLVSKFDNKEHQLTAFEKQNLKGDFRTVFAILTSSREMVYFLKLLMTEIGRFIFS
jgi:hypothetical protein